MSLFTHPLVTRVKEKLKPLQTPEIGRQQMPAFWRRASPLSVIYRELLMPLTVAYYAVFLWKQKNTKVQKLPVPVWCVGNATAGGGGKTPFALLLAAELTRRGRKPAFLSRGFGGVLRQQPVKVDLQKHTALEVGDEPLLLARIAPCYVCANRFAAGQMAIAEGADILIMDDGLQHFALAKDVSFLLLDGAFGYGNFGVIPGGPLREPPFKVYPRVQAAVQVGEDTAGALKKYPLPADLPLLPMEFAVDGAHAPLPPKEPEYLAFAGIALPEKFFSTLKSVGYKVVQAVPFPDHYQFAEYELRELKRLAEQKKAKLITTEKDMVRLPEAFRAEVEVLPVSLKPLFPEAFQHFLDSHLR